jgi:conjugal transfer/entry exclusion protein
MRTAKRCVLALSLVLVAASMLVAQSVNDIADKIQAYKLAVQTTTTLNEQLVLVQKAINQVQAKVQSLQEQVEDGIASSKPLLEMYRKQLDSLEDSKDEADGKLKELKAIVDQLKKDPEVGAEISADEGLRDMTIKLDEASDILQQTAP